MTFNYSEIFRILWKSLKDALSWNGWKWFITGSIGTLSSLLQFGEKFFEFSVTRSIVFAGIGLGGLYVLRFTLIFVKETFKYFHEVYKNSAYGDAIILLKDSFATMHYYRKTPGHQDTEFMKSMMAFCNNLELLFTKIVGGECSVSVKVPMHDVTVNEHTVLANLTRDVKHANRDTDQYRLSKHTLIGNTAFTYAFNKVITGAKEKYYVNNCVNGTKNYENTSRECYANGILPYNSELVFPIIPIISDSTKNFDCLGFICIDCKKENAFGSKYEIAIIEGVADGIYDIISERNNQINKK